MGDTIPVESRGLIPEPGLVALADLLPERLVVPGLLGIARDLRDTDPVGEGLVVKGRHVAHADFGGRVMSGETPDRHPVHEHVVGCLRDKSLRAEIALELRQQSPDRGGKFLHQRRVTGPLVVIHQGLQPEQGVARVKGMIAGIPHHRRPLAEILPDQPGIAVSEGIVGHEILDQVVAVVGDRLLMCGGIKMMGLEIDLHRGPADLPETVQEGITALEAPLVSDRLGSPVRRHFQDLDGLGDIPELQPDRPHGVEAPRFKGLDAVAQPEDPRRSLPLARQFGGREGDLRALGTTDLEADPGRHHAIEDHIHRAVRAHQQGLASGQGTGWHRNRAPRDRHHRLHRIDDLHAGRQFARLKFPLGHRHRRCDPTPSGVVKSRGTPANRLDRRIKDRTLPRLVSLSRRQGDLGQEACRHPPPPGIRSERHALAVGQGASGLKDHLGSRIGQDGHRIRSGMEEGRQIAEIIEGGALGSPPGEVLSLIRRPPRNEDAVQEEQIGSGGGDPCLGTGGLLRKETLPP